MRGSLGVEKRVQGGKRRSFADWMQGKRRKVVCERHKRP